MDGCVLDSSKISADGRYSWQRRASVYGIHSGVPSLVGNSSKLCQLCVKDCPFVGSVGSVESYLLSASYKKLHGPGAHTERLVGGSKTDSRSLFTASNYHFEALWSIILISVE